MQKKRQHEDKRHCKGDADTDKIQENLKLIKYDYTQKKSQEVYVCIYIYSTLLRVNILKTFNIVFENSEN